MNIHTIEERQSILYRKHGVTRGQEKCKNGMIKRVDGLAYCKRQRNDVANSMMRRKTRLDVTSDGPIIRVISRLRKSPNDMEDVKKWTKMELERRAGRI